MKKTSAFAIFVSTLTFINSAALASTIPVPADNSSTTTFSRGYWFTAPVSFTITGVSVLGATGTEYAEIVSFPGNPPDFSVGPTTNFTVLNYVSGAGAATIGVNTPVTAGEVIGVLGFDTGCNCIHYGTGPFSSSVGGSPITLARLITQQSLTTQAGSIAADASGGSLGLVQLTYADASAPEPASIVLVGVGLFLAVMIRRPRAFRRQKQAIASSSN